MIHEGDYETKNQKGNMDPSDMSNYTLKQWYELYEQNLDPEDELVYLYCSKPLK